MMNNEGVSHNATVGTGPEPCFECRHRGRVPGSAHASCNHPDLDPKARLTGMATVMLFHKYEPFGLSADGHGVRNGWCIWPMDFDPVWVKSCARKESVGSRPAVAA